jgi:YD repeat-containing protein
VTEQFYDWAGRLTRTVDPEGGVVDNAYDTFGRLRTSTATVRAVADQPALTDVTTTGYSWLGYATSTDDGATTASTTYNAFGEVATQAVGTLDPTTYTYDGLGRVRRVTNPDQTTLTHVYDPAGRRLSTTRADSSGTDVSTESSDYDADGNQTSITSPRGYATTYDYDARGALEEVTVPVSDTESITTSYTYDKTGNLSSYTDGDGNTTRYAYNPYDLRSHVVEPPPPPQSGNPRPTGRMSPAMTPPADRSTSTSPAAGKCSGTSTPSA